MVNDQQQEGAADPSMDQQKEKDEQQQQQQQAPQEKKDKEQQQQQAPQEKKDKEQQQQQQQQAPQEKKDKEQQQQQQAPQEKKDKEQQQQQQAPQEKKDKEQQQQQQAPQEKKDKEQQQQQQQAPQEKKDKEQQKGKKMEDEALTIPTPPELLDSAYEHRGAVESILEGGWLFFDPTKHKPVTREFGDSGLPDGWYLLRKRTAGQGKWTDKYYNSSTGAQDCRSPVNVKTALGLSTGGAGALKAWICDWHRPFTWRRCRPLTALSPFQCL